MNGSRELNINECLSALRGRMYPILGLSLLAGALAFAFSFLLTPRFTSRSLVQVSAQVLPTGYVKPIVTERLGDRIASLEQRVLTRARLLPMIEKLGLARDGAIDRTLDQIRSRVSVTPADPGTSPSSSTATKKKIFDRDDIPGFYIGFTWNNARQAQQVCSAITSMLLDENLKVREQVGQNTTDFLARQLEQAKHNLDSQDGELANFKRRHLGRLPGDVDNTLKILSGLDSQLDANTQALERAQEEKSFAESLLNQETAAWKAKQEAPNFPSLQEQLITLQNQLVSLQSHYTEAHPDVVKTKNDIAEIKAELKDSKKEPEKVQASEGSHVTMEPPEILRLRERIHQEDGVIERATLEQTRLKERIDSFQARLALSPDVEEQFKKLTRDSETAHTIYTGLLANKNSAEMQTEMEREQQGEQIKLLESANLPDAASFPLRWMFLAGGLAAGLSLSVGTIIAKEISDRSIQTDSDVVDLLNLPTLASLPYALERKTPRSRKGRWREWLRPLPAK